MNLIVLLSGLPLGQNCNDCLFTEEMDCVDQCITSCYWNNEGCSKIELQEDGMSSGEITGIVIGSIVGYVVLSFFINVCIAKSNPRYQNSTRALAEGCKLECACFILPIFWIFLLCWDFRDENGDYHDKISSGWKGFNRKKKLYRTTTQPIKVDLESNESNQTLRF